jgi:hypothetical protein
MSVRHFVPPAFDAAMIAGLASAPFGRAGPVAALAAVAAYALFMAAVASREAVKGSRGYYWVALVLIHHAWALGFLHGMVRFAPCWLKSDPPVRRLVPADARSVAGR